MLYILGPVFIVGKGFFSFGDSMFYSLVFVAVNSLFAAFSAGERAGLTFFCYGYMALILSSARTIGVLDSVTAYAD